MFDRKAKGNGKKSGTVVLKDQELSDKEQAAVKGGGGVIEDKNAAVPVATRADSAATNVVINTLTRK